MLRITTERHQKSVLLKLEGRVEGPWVEVLKKTWIDAVSGDGHREIGVDLDGVSSADSDGRALLVAMQTQGVALIKPSGFMRRILGYEESRFHNKLKSERGE